MNDSAPAHSSSFADDINILNEETSGTSVKKRSSQEGSSADANELSNRPKGSPLHYVVSVIVRLLVRVILLVPNTLRLGILTIVSRSIFLLVPRLRTTSLKNIELAFPDSSPQERREIARGAAHSLARLINDCLRLETLTDDWVREHIDIPYLETYLATKTHDPERPYLFVTGHLGSFDLMAYSIGLLGHPLAFIVRRFKNPFLDAWFTGVRSRTGNTVIERTGAMRKVLKELRSGNDVGILFDQNVTRKHAIFVDWFGRPAATSFAPALATLSTSCRVAAVCITHVRDDYYRIEVAEIEVEDIRSDTHLEKEEKLRLLTERFSTAYQKMILAHPNEWFWFHRRWKTTPSKAGEKFYQS